MLVNIKALSELAEKLGPVKVARLIGVDYSHLNRVLRKEKTAGLKMITGIQKMCKKEGLNSEEYIFFDEPLSTNNGKAVSLDQAS